MILLNGHSLTAARAVTAENMSLQLKERDSTANMTPVSLDGIGVNSWLKDDREPGTGIVWRVRSIQQAFQNRTPTVSLEHVICTLKDLIIFGEITPKEITGSSSATTCTARQAVEYILGRQSDWTLGSFDYGSVTNAYKFDGETLYDALETITGTLTDAVWTYDMSSYPFTLNIVQRSAGVDSELRDGRNLRTISKTIDKSGMYTRFYPIGKDDLHLPNEYVERNVSTYGVISKTETDQSRSTVAELEAWANERLNAHAQPVVTVTVDGLELSQDTGQPLDKLTIGKICRIPLPEFDTTIQERITELNYPDKINQPKVVKITLANSRNDVTKIIADAIKSGGRGGRGTARKDKEDHAWFEDTNDHVAMVATGIIGVDAQGNPNWTRLSEFIADGEGLHAKVETQMGEATDRIASLEINEEEIRSDVSESKSTIYSTIQQTANGIHTEIVNTTSGLYAYVDQTASYFRQTYISKTNQVWIQDSDPRNGGATPKIGDIWVESTHQGTWDGAEGFDWEHDEDYDWTQVQGAKVWGWQNDKWELVSDQQQVVTMTDVEETSEHIVQRAIKILTNDDGNLSVYRAELLVEGDRIRSEVNEVLSGFGSTIEQTAASIRSEVHAAQSSLYSFILQTASQITIRVGESNMIFSGMSKPEGTTDHPLVEGDMWLETTFQRTWADMEELDGWIDDEDFDWSDLKGSKIHVYDATLGDFREVLDEQVLAQDTDIEETSGKIALIARSVKQVDGKVDVFRSELSVKADRIESRVNQRLADVGSTITQTATQIRSEVHAAQSQIYSSITQTASQIRSEVVNSLSGVASSITQTANSIRSEVNAANSQIYSSITQTASSIRSEVANSVSGLSSSITQNANKIAIVVDSNNNIKPAAIVSSINNGSSSIIISANHINLDGYVKASDITANYISSKISLISTMTANTIQASTVKITPVSGMGYVNVDTAYNGSSLTRSGNTYKLRLAKMNGNYDEYTFSRATSLSGAWSSGTFTVTASPQGDTFSATAYAEGNGTPTKVSGWQALLSVPYTIKSYVNGSENPTDTGKTGSIQADATVIYNAGRDETTPYCAHSGNTEMPATINLGWNETYSVWAGFQKSDGSTYKWSKEYKIHGKALPSISNVDRKSTGISGTSAGDVHTKTGNYVTFDMGGSSYYIRIE